MQPDHNTPPELQLNLKDYMKKLPKFETEYEKLEHIADRIDELEGEKDEAAEHYFKGHIFFAKEHSKRSFKAYVNAIRRYKHIHNMILINLMK